MTVSNILRFLKLERLLLECYCFFSKYSILYFFRSKALKEGRYAYSVDMASHCPLNNNYRVPH